MTFVRHLDGRDRGHVVEMPFVDAQRLIGEGAVAEIDPSEPGAFDFQDLSAEEVVEAAQTEFLGEAHTETLGEVVSCPSAEKALTDRQPTPELPPAGQGKSLAGRLRGKSGRR